MHAASVHPEPGSNSRLKSFFLAYFLYCFLFRNCRDLVAIYLIASFSYSLYFLSSLFNFQRSSRHSLLCERLIIISLLFLLVNTFFLIFILLVVLWKIGFYILLFCSLFTKGFTKHDFISLAERIQVITHIL